MSLTKEKVIDRIEIVGEHRNVQIREATVIKEDGKILSKSFHRHVLAPDSDKSKETAEVQAICNIVHTDLVKTEWAAFKKSNK